MLHLIASVYCLFGVRFVGWDSSADGVCCIYWFMICPYQAKYIEDIQIIVVLSVL